MLAGVGLLLTRGRTEGLGDGENARHLCGLDDDGRGGGRMTTMGGWKRHQGREWRLGENHGDDGESARMRGANVGDEDEEEECE